jgi:peptidoglycan/LPS O-acetylase OafA/YrhL
MTFHVNVLEATRGYLPGNWDILWSLSVEGMFYLFSPLVCVVLGRSKWLVALLCLFVALGPLGRTVWSHCNETWREYSYLGGMDAIGLGCLTALWVSYIRMSRSVLALLFIAGAAWLLVTLCFTNWVRAIGLPSLGLDMTLIALGTCMLIAVASQTGWHSWSLIKPIRVLGQRSYTHVRRIYIV